MAGHWRIAFYILGWVIQRRFTALFEFILLNTTAAVENKAIVFSKAKYCLSTLLTCVTVFARASAKNLSKITI